MSVISIEEGTTGGSMSTMLTGHQVCTELYSPPCRETSSPAWGVPGPCLNLKRQRGHIATPPPPPPPAHNPPPPPPPRWMCTCTNQCGGGEGSINAGLLKARVGGGAKSSTGGWACVLLPHSHKGRGREVWCSGREEVCYAVLTV